jgi:hypothetical protein
VEGADISIRSAALGRPLSDGRATAVLAHAGAIELEQTVCYTCTDWHTCLVFLTHDGLRLPLCEACLPFVVERAVAAQAGPG